MKLTKKRYQSLLEFSRGPAYAIFKGRGKDCAFDRNLNKIGLLKREEWDFGNCVRYSLTEEGRRYLNSFETKYT